MKIILLLIILLAKSQAVQFENSFAQLKVRTGQDSGEVVFRFKNDAPDTVHIARYAASCDCLGVEIIPKELEFLGIGAGEVGTIRVKLKGRPSPSSNINVVFEHKGVFEQHKLTVTTVWVPKLTLSSDILSIPKGDSANEYALIVLDNSVPKLSLSYDQKRLSARLQDNKIIVKSIDQSNRLEQIEVLDASEESGKIVHVIRVNFY